MDETYDFGDLNLQEQGTSGSRPSGDYYSIDSIINKVIYVTGWEEVDTDNGVRTLVKFKWQLNGAETAFFTNSKKLLKILQSPNIRFPFSTIIKVVIIRDMTGFEFRSAKEVVSKEDEDNLNMYIIRKRSYMKQRR